MRKGRLTKKIAGRGEKIRSAPREVENYFRQTRTGTGLMPGYFAGT